jgi:ABC-type proline/glycine betaine transport system ATPase subunit
MVTHDMAEAFVLGERVGVLDAGELIACDTPDRIAQTDDQRVRPLIESALAPALRRPS